jgi:hypothetical protein
MVVDQEALPAYVKWWCSDAREGDEPGVSPA